MSTAYTGAARQQADVDFWALFAQPQEPVSGQSAVLFNAQIYFLFTTVLFANEVVQYVKNVLAVCTSLR